MTNNRDVTLKVITSGITTLALAAAAEVIHYTGGLVTLGLVSVGVYLYANAAELADEAAVSRRSEECDVNPSLLTDLDVTGSSLSQEITVDSSNRDSVQSLISEERSVNPLPSNENRDSVQSLSSEERSVDSLPPNENRDSVQSLSSEERSVDSSENATNRYNPIMAVYKAIMDFFSKMVNCIRSFFSSTEQVSVVKYNYTYTTKQAVEVNEDDRDKVDASHDSNRRSRFSC